MIEPLRTMRIMNYAAWLGRRWTDPAFPRSFPWFNDARYWGDHILELREQLAAWSVLVEKLAAVTAECGLALADAGRRLDGITEMAGDLLVHTIRSCIPADDSARNSNDAVDAVIEHLDANFYKQIPLPELAARCNLSSRRFTDLFKLRTGRTLTNYVNERRINYAMERLRETQHILYSCYESGFRDVTYFYRVFKRQSGMTPGDFLASCKTTDHPSVAS